MPLEGFMFRQFGAGTAVIYIMERINEEYVRRRGIAIKA